MFEEFVGLEIEEHDLFALVTNAIIENYSKMGAQLYYFEIENAGEGKVRVSRRFCFADDDDYSDYFYSHQFEPTIFKFQKQGDFVNVVLAGVYRFTVCRIKN